MASRSCLYPTAFYLAVNPWHLEYLIKGTGPGCCQDDTHNPAS